MSRYIDADKIPFFGYEKWKAITTKSQIDRQPTADVRENVRGEWGRTKNGFIYCSNCEETWYDNAWTDNWHYCPNCGADMRGEA